MALFDLFIRSELERLINLSDNKVRNDYHSGLVVGEDDYTSNLTLRIRSEIMNNLSLQVATFSQKLPPPLERKWGVDACIILIDKNIGEYKVCLFEAKAVKNNWDYMQPKSNPPVSHFSTQLRRQVVPNNKGYAIWEQFYSQRENGISTGNMEPFGSTCIIHDIAINHKGRHPNNIIWNTSDINELAKTNSKKMGGLVKSVCECNFGEAQSVSNIRETLANTIPAKYIIFLEDEQTSPIDEEFQSYSDIYINAHSNYLDVAMAYP